MIKKILKKIKITRFNVNKNVLELCRLNIIYAKKSSLDPCFNPDSCRDDTGVCIRCTKNQRKLW
jgi:hypothetical protein